MRTIFECETEIGRCDDDFVDGTGASYSTAEPWTIYAHTTASLNGSKRMLKIEQRCYLRRSSDIYDPSWVRPEMIFEPVLGSESEAVETVRGIHDRFVRTARERLPDQALPAIFVGVAVC